MGRALSGGGPREMWSVSLGELLVEVWRQTLADGHPVVEWEGESFRVGRTSHQGLRIVVFAYAGRRLEGIEQNPLTRSNWAKLAQQGQRIMQFSADRRYFANVCEGRLTRYPAWKELDLPE
jgi:hypothetical protein